VLQEDATLTLRELAERLALSQSTVWRRVQELEGSGVITGRVTLVDPRKAGLNVCVFVHVNLRDHGAQSRERFDTFIRTEPRILESFAVTGEYDYVLIVRTDTVEAFDEFLMHHLLSHPSVARASSSLTLRQQKYTTALPL
jgi:Lrp/AsnC family transcriptional regulator